MSACIKQWLQDRIGYDLELNPETIGEELFDGKIFYKILKSYNYATDCQKVRVAKDPFSALQNLKDMCVWFRMIGVPHDDLYLRKIANKDGRQALRFLYELYAGLENKEHSNILFMAKDVPSNLEAIASDDMYSDIKLEEGSQPALAQVQHCFKESVVDQNELTKLFTEEQHTIRKKCILECLKRREEARSLVDPVEVEIASLDGAGDANTKRMPQDYVESFYKKIQELGEMKLGEEGLIKCTPQEYIDLLKIWRKKSLMNEYRNKKTQSTLLNTVWQHMIQSQTEEFHNCFNSKLLVQSTFEKNLAQRLNRIHHSFIQLSEQSSLIRDLLKSEINFENNMQETNNVYNESMAEAYEEKKRVYELHNRLYKRKKIRKHKRIVQYCVETTNDLITYAFLHVAFKELFKQEVPPRELVYQWKDVFYKGLLPKPSSSKDLQQTVEVDVEASDENIDDDYECILLDNDSSEYINEQNLHSYLYLTGPWFVESIWPSREYDEEPQTKITGFIVHRLLEAKYPFPDVPQKADLPEYKIKIILTPFTETNVKQKLSRLLEGLNIALIDVSMATNYCLSAYEKEKGVTEIGQTLKETVEERKPEVKRSKSFIGTSKKPAKGVTADKGGKGKAKKKKSHTAGQKEAAEEENNKKSKKKVEKGVPAKKKTLPAWEEKATQAPSVMEIVYTRAGLLGKMAFEITHGGKRLVDLHIVYMLIEYMKTLEEDTQGWILLNYPLTFQQAALLEYMLGGIRIPTVLSVNNYNIDTKQHYIDDSKLAAFEVLLELFKTPPKTDNLEQTLGEVEGEVFIVQPLANEELEDPDELSSIVSKEMSRTLEELIELRTSNILPRPNRPFQLITEKSYFTKYINLVRQRTHSVLNTFGYMPNKIIEPYLFYDYIGITRRVTQQKSIDGNTLKKIVEIILQDKQIDTIKQADVETEVWTTQTVVDDIEKPRPKPLLPSRKLINFIIKNSELIPHEKVLLKKIGKNKFLERCIEKAFGMKRTEEDEIDEQEITQDEEERACEEDMGEEEEEYGGDPGVLPATEKWEYSELPIPLDLMKCLATIWETIESTYLENLKELFLLYRNVDCKVIPYKMFIRDVYERSVNEGDGRQAVISDFQMMFNFVDEELRRNEDMHYELHCRTYELFAELCEICDKKRETAEMSRKELISENWISKHLYALINLSINIIQMELDRFIDTLQLLYDYHLSSMGKLPEKGFEKIILEKLKYPKIDESRNVGGKLKKTKKNSMKLKKSTKFAAHFAKSGHFTMAPRLVELILLNPELSQEPNPLHSVMNDVVKDVEAKINSVKTHYDNIIQNQYRELLHAQMNPTPIEVPPVEQVEVRNVLEKKKPKGGGKIKNKKSVADTPEVKTVVEEVAVLPPEPVDFTDRQLEGPLHNLLWEWWEAVQNETNRVIFRLKLIEARTLIDITEAFSIIKDVFLEFRLEIINRYNVEMKNIHLATNLFKAAIEDNRIVRPVIVLHKDDFFVNDNINLFPHMPNVPPTSPLLEPSSQFVFTVKQLTHMLDKFKLAAPEGRIVEDSFVNILEDMSLFGRECGEPFLPKGWIYLTNTDLRRLVQLIFRESIMVDWREFLLQCLNLEFPNVEQLLDARDQFLRYDKEGDETITWNDFKQVVLWFDEGLMDTLEDDLRIILVKEFLFKLYQINEKETNYAAMLMSFCKDVSDNEGFAKALSLAKGKAYIVTNDELYKCEDFDFLDAPIIVEDILNELLHHIFQLKEGVIIKEIESEVSLNKYDWYTNRLDVQRDTKEKKKKKKKDKLKMKTPDEETVESQRRNTVWVSLVPYDMTLSLIIYFLRYYPMVPNFLCGSLALAEELKQLYLDEGRWNLIRVYQLLNSKFMENIFKITGCFKIVNVGEIAEKLAGERKKKSSILEEEEFEEEPAI